MDIYVSLVKLINYIRRISRYINVAHVLSAARAI